MKFIIRPALFLVLLTGCEKRVDFKLKNSTELLTVDARIENDTDPVVVLTKSFNYFSKITPDILANSLITDAEVFISNGTVTHQLKRFEVPLTGNYKFSYYSTDPANVATRVTGEIGKQYNLRIIWQGKEYTSKTTIPDSKKKMDSIWWERVPNSPDTSTRVVVRGKFTDPPAFGDYIRYFTSVNGETFLPGLNSVFDDQLVNGTVYTADIDRGVDRNTEINFDDYGFFKKGDTVTVKFSSINKATFDFWRTVEFSYQSIGNPFSSPTQIIGNINNGALGYFGGYANQFKTIIIPK
jgi:hypothetical protein